MLGEKNLPMTLKRFKSKESPVKFEIDRRVEIMVEGRRDGRYSWDRLERERSTGLEEQI